jgi:hypothetical protein
MNNSIRKDRYTPTVYIDELSMLSLSENGTYSVADYEHIQDVDSVVDNMTTKCQPERNQPTATQYRLGKVSIDKDSIDKDRRGGSFVPPTVDEVREFCSSRNNRVDAEAFVDFYVSKGWMVGKNKMKDWRAAVRTWERRDGDRDRDKSTDNNSFIGVVSNNDNSRNGNGTGATENGIPTLIRETNG